MAENSQYATVGIQTYQDFIASQEATIDLLGVRYKRKGIEMSEDEAWRYLAWCNQTMIDVAIQLGGSQVKEMFDYVRLQVAVGCAGAYTTYKTGKLAPPTGVRFDSIEDHAAKTTDLMADVSTETPDLPNVFKGYL
jgi:hypothetical protein